MDSKLCEAFRLVKEARKHEAEAERYQEEAESAEYELDALVAQYESDHARMTARMYWRDAEALCGT